MASQRILSRYLPIRPVFLAAGAWVALFGGLGVWAQSPPADPVDRLDWFLRQSARATELFNASRPEEALSILQQLSVTCADLDDDGHVAITLADCLAALGRDAEALSAYESARSAHPELSARIAEKVAELELAGPITDGLLNRFREVVRREPGNAGARWRLARALQKRAKILLDEAARAFQAVAASDPTMASLPAIVGYAANAQEVADDLGAMIRCMEDRWGWARRPLVRLPECDDGSNGDRTVRFGQFRAEWRTRLAEGASLRVEIRLEEDTGEIGVAVEGKALKLAPGQKALVRRHIERIHALLDEAIQEIPAGADPQP